MKKGQLIFTALAVGISAVLGVIFGSMLFGHPSAEALDELKATRAELHELKQAWTAAVQMPAGVTAQPGTAAFRPGPGGDEDWSGMFPAWLPNPPKLMHPGPFEPEPCTDGKRDSRKTLSAGTGRVHIHYHIQHHAGTMMWDCAMYADECGPRACLRRSQECFFSLSEEVEAQKVLERGYTYISYEMMLPPRFPMPFVGHRDKFFFTVIMRHPLDRLLSKTSVIDYTRQFPEEMAKGDYTSTVLLPDKPHGPLRGGYPHENLALRWLAGKPSPLQLTLHDVARAKCRLLGFDLVISDTLSTETVQKVLCNGHHWRWNCTGFKFKKPKSHNRTARERIRNDALYSVLVERHRMDFELYDFAMGLARKHLLQYGVRTKATLPPLSASSYVDAMQDVLKLSDSGLKEMRAEVKMQAEGPGTMKALGVDNLQSFCNRMHDEWSNNPVVPAKLLGGLH
eukprot:TRINITY_DN40322_c0_g1_i1.p1 TRINITY_DN40322_c0_g1~~TRINITY_DN40322_c0_g1_i1.p1  ORF type:complete len:453 (+),score=67.41 TRINITY_DN40322_c0_g1_i1:118-1476(+)